MTPSRSAGRPLKKVLTEEKIVQEARSQLTRTGGFTMSSLAKGLKVAPSSIYNHLASRDEVLSRISDLIVREIDTTPLQDAVARLANAPAISLDERRTLWVEATRAWAYSYWKAFSHSVELTSTLAITPITDAPGTLAMYETVVQSFVAFGWEEDEVLTVIEAIEAYLFGSSIDALAPTSIFNPGTAPEESPALSSAYKKFSATVENPAETAFARGIKALLNGFAFDLH